MNVLIILGSWKALGAIALVMPGFSQTVHCIFFIKDKKSPSHIGWTSLILIEYLF